MLCQEFGREDNIPLWTSERSGKLCGVRRDVNYEVSIMVIIIILIVDVPYEDDDNDDDEQDSDEEGCQL